MKKLACLAMGALVACTGSSASQSPSGESGEGSSSPVTRAAITLKQAPDGVDKQAWQFDVGLGAADAVQLVCDAVDGEAERHRITRPAAAVHHLVLRGLRADTRYACYAGRLDAPLQRSRTVEIQTEPLPAGIQQPPITVPSPDVAETGYTLYNYATMNDNGSYDNQYLIILDALGNVRWYYPGIGGGDIDASWLGDDQILFGGSSYNYIHTCPTIVGLDKNLKWTSTTARVSPYEQVGNCTHDEGLSADRTSSFGLVGESIDSTWNGFIIRQVDIATNKVVWFWDSYQDGVLKNQLPAGSAMVTSPYHANAVWDQWESGRLYIYVSLRNLGQVIKIDYASKRIVWYLGPGGNFTLYERDGTPADSHRWFSGQHDVKVSGNRITMHDNGSAQVFSGSGMSRALVLTLDESTFSAYLTFEYAEPNWSEPGWGGFDIWPDGNALVAMGHCFLCTTPPDHYSSLVELDPEGRAIWRADFQDETVIMYRAEHIDGCAAFDNQTFCPSGK